MSDTPTTPTVLDAVEALLRRLENGQAWRSQMLAVQAHLAELREDVEIAARARALTLVPVDNLTHARDIAWATGWNNARANVLGADGVAEGHQP